MSWKLPFIYPLSIADEKFSKFFKSWFKLEAEHGRLTTSSTDDRFRKSSRLSLIFPSP
jgi:hypothetical protein